MANRDKTVEIPGQLMEMSPELEALYEDVLLHEPWAIRWFEIMNETEFVVVMDFDDDTVIVESPGFRVINKHGGSAYVTPAIYEMATAIRNTTLSFLENSQQ